MTDKCKTFVARWDHAMCSTCGEEHNRPAPTPTPAPGLDLDAVERDVAHLDGPHSLFDDRTLGRVLAVCNAAPALIAEVRALRAAAEEREADMHMRIRAGYDKTVADAWRAEVAKRDAEIADLRALVESQRRDYLDVCDAIAPETSGPADAAAKVRALRAKLAEAKRLGLIAARVVLDDDTDLPAIAAPRVATVGELLATAPVGSIVEFVDCAFWYQARVNVDDSVEWYETRRRHATDARWMPWRRGIPPVRPSARLVPAAEADADPNQRDPLLAATAPVCPGPDCPMCNGEACDKCNPGPGRPRCDHDGQERHEPPTATPRCSCTHEAGDSRCDAHPTCSECGATTPRPVDGCDEDSDFAERFDREIKAARRRTAERIAARNLAAAYHPHREDAP